MTAYIVGGSNSILASGWTREAPAIFRGAEVRNLSIGATCSVTGLYRALFTADLQPGDTVLWEYALNDANHVANGVLPADFLLRYLEILLAHCARRGVRFAALLFLSRRLERQDEDPPYKTALRQLLTRWGVPYADISAEYRRELGVAKLAPSHFELPNHYHTAAPIMDFIIARATDLAGQATVPVVAPREYSDPARGVILLDGWTGGVAGEVGTRLFRSRAWQPGEGMRLPIPQDCRIFGVLTYAAPNGGGFAFSAGQRRAVISATLGDPDEKARLSPVFVPPGQARVFSLPAGATLAIDWAADASAAIRVGYNKRQLSPKDIDGRDGWLLGLLAEVEGGLGRE